MIKSFQHTLAEHVSLEGIGLHTGKKSKIKVFRVWKHFSKSERASCHTHTAHPQKIARRRVKNNKFQAMCVCVAYVYTNIEIEIHIYPPKNPRPPLSPICT